MAFVRFVAFASTRSARPVGPCARVKESIVSSRRRDVVRGAARVAVLRDAVQRDRGTGQRLRLKGHDAHEGTKGGHEVLLIGFGDPGYGLRAARGSVLLPAAFTVTADGGHDVLSAGHRPHGWRGRQRHKDHEAHEGRKERHKQILLCEYRRRVVSSCRRARREP